MMQKTKPKDLMLSLKNKNIKQKTKDFKFTKHIRFLSIDKIKEWYKEKYRFSKYFLIVMNTRNDRYKMFSVATTEKHFIYNKGSYLIDPDLSKTDIHTGLAMLFYHEDSSIPFRIKFDIDELIKKVSETDKGVSLALNPVSLKGFINSQVIEKVLKGQELTDDMAFMKKLIIINLLVTALIGFIIAKSQGWF